MFARELSFILSSVTRYSPFFSSVIANNLTVPKCFWFLYTFNATYKKRKMVLSDEQEKRETTLTTSNVFKMKLSYFQLFFKKCCLCWNRHSGGPLTAHRSHERNASNITLGDEHEIIQLQQTQHLTNTYLKWNTFFEIKPMPCPYLRQQRL